VAAGSVGSQRVGGIDLFSRLNGVPQSLAVEHLAAARIVVDHESGIDQRPLIFQQPIDAIGIAARFLVGVEDHDDIAIGFEPLLLQPDQIGGQDGDPRS